MRNHRVRLCIKTGAENTKSTVVVKAEFVLRPTRKAGIQPLKEQGVTDSPTSRVGLVQGFHKLCAVIINKSVLRAIRIACTHSLWVLQSRRAK